MSLLMIPYDSLVNYTLKQVMAWENLTSAHFLGKSV